MDVRGTARIAVPTALAVGSAASGLWPWRDWWIFEEAAARGMHAYDFAKGYGHALTGPLTLGLSWALPFWLGAAIVLALLPLTIWRQRIPLPVGALVAVPWGGLAAWGHIDDAIAVTCLLEARLQTGWRRGLLIGVAVLAKPWAVLGLPFLGRDVRAWGVAAATQLVWLPFLPDLVRMDAPSIQVQRDSVMRLYLGFLAQPGFGWRAAQLLAMIAVCWLLIRRGRADAAIAGALAVRILLDPGGFDYYSATLLLAIAVMHRGRNVALGFALVQWLMYLYGLWSIGGAALHAICCLVVLGCAWRRPRESADVQPVAPEVAAVR